MQMTSNVHLYYRSFILKIERLVAIRVFNKCFQKNTLVGSNQLNYYANANTCTKRVSQLAFTNLKFRLRRFSVYKDTFINEPVGIEGFRVFEQPRISHDMIEVAEDSWTFGNGEAVKLDIVESVMGNAKDQLQQKRS